MKGIILSGGLGTRLKPFTSLLSKHLLPVYDKPMIYYSLSVLMLLGIREILIIVNKMDYESFVKILGHGENYGIKIQYDFQEKPSGISEAFIIGENFIGKDNVTLILGDNFFYGQDFTIKLRHARRNHKGATLFTYQVKDPNKFGILEFKKDGSPKKIVEKPSVYKSNIAVTGLYMFDNKVIDFAKKSKKSERGELEITSINNDYLKIKEVKTIELGRGYAWFDMGEFDKLLKVSQFIKTIQDLQGIKIGCLEEIAFNNKWISSDKLIMIIRKSKNYEEKKYLKSLLKNETS